MSLMLTCRQASELASREIDGPISPWQRVHLRLHLAMCGFCRRYRDQLRLLVRLAARRGRAATASADRPSSRLPEEARERVRRAVRDAAGQRPGG